MEKKKVRIAVIGCGGISEAHLRAYTSNKDTQLVAVADIDEEKARAKANKFGTKYYTDYNQLLDEKEVDGASICVPPFLHKKIILDLIKGKINVLCEKPLTVNIEDAKEMVNEAQKANVILMTGFCWRFHNPLIEAKDWINQGKLGNLLMFRLRFGGYTNMEGTWFSKREKGGGVIKESAIHSFDLFRWLIGEMKDVSARKGTLNQEMEAEDSFISLLRSREGVLGVIEGSWATPFSENRIEIYGSRGSIVVDVFGNKARFTTDKFVEIVESNEEKHNRFQNEIDHFINCIQEECEPLVTGKDGIESIRVADALLESIEKRRWISLT